MAKGREIHDARMAELSRFGKDLARLAKSKCELCEAAGEKLSIFEVPPVPAQPDMDRCLLLCQRCTGVSFAVREKVTGEQWRFLSEASWSEIPMVQVMAIRLLKRLSASQAWAREALDTLFLDEEMETLVTEAE